MNGWIVFGLPLASYIDDCNWKKFSFFNCCSTSFMDFTRFVINLFDCNVITINTNYSWDFLFNFLRKKGKYFSGKNERKKWNLIYKMWNTHIISVRHSLENDVFFLLLWKIHIESLMSLSLLRNRLTLYH